MPIDISTNSLQPDRTGGANSNTGAKGETDGVNDLFAALLDLLGGDAPVEGQHQGQTSARQDGRSFFNMQLGDINAALDNADLPSSLSDLAKLLGIETEGEPDPDATLAGLAGPLADLLNTLATKLELAGDAPTDQALAALRLARGLIKQAGGGDVDLALQTANRDTAQTPLAAQLRAAAADLDLVRNHIPIPTARIDAAAIFNGTAPTLDELLNPRQGQNGSGTRGDAPADTTRLANSLGATFASKAGATANQPAAGANGGQTLAAALADAGINANLTAQNQTRAQTDPLPNAQITPTGAPTLSSDVSAAARPMQAAYQAPQINMQQLAFQIARQFQAGNSRFQIRMDPPELGRIDVRMKVDAHGAIHASLAVDRPETLDMLRHDSRLLERALQQAGLDQAKTNLEFSLRQNNSGGEQDGSNQQSAQGESPLSVPVEETIPVSAPLNAYRGTASPGGLNLWV